MGENKMSFGEDALWKQAKLLFRLRHYQHFQSESELSPFLDRRIPAYEVGSGSWLKKARQAQFLTIERAARNARISKGTYQKIENSEERGSVSLRALAKAAAALDCELVYAIRLRSRKLFSEQPCRLLLEEAFRHSSIQRLVGERKIQAAVARAGWLLQNAAFRRQQGWSQLREEKTEDRILADGAQFLESSFKVKGSEES